MTTPLRDMVQSAYDIQMLRIQHGNRLCQCWYRSHGIEPGTKPDDDLSTEDKNLLDQLKAEYKRMADAVSKLRAKDFQPTEMMDSWAFLQMVARYVELVKLEKQHFKAVEYEVEQHPMWALFLEEVAGCGPAMAACLLSRLDPHKARYASSFWRFAGYDVGDDGKGRSRRSEHLIDREYVAKDGETKTRKSLTYDPWLKTKLYVLATCMMKAGGKYATVYRNYKHRLESMPPLEERQHVAANVPLKDPVVDWAKATKGHRHNAAMRYMMKMFLADFWRAWREYEGLETPPMYHVAKLGLRDHAA